MNNGFITIHRKMLEWEWFDDANVFRLFMLCLLKANWKDGNYRGQEIKRGSFVTSREKLAQELRLSEQQIRTAINKLKSTNEITIKSTNSFTIISITNYNLYQEQQQANQPTDNQRITNEQPTDNHNRIKKEVNKETINTLNARAPDEIFEDVSECSFSSKAVKQDCKSHSHPQYKNFLHCFNLYPVKKKQEESWNEWIRLFENGTLPTQAQILIGDNIQLMQNYDEQWQRGFIPTFDKYLNGKRWNDEPYSKPVESSPLTKIGYEYEMPDSYTIEDE